MAENIGDIDRTSGLFPPPIDPPKYDSSLPHGYAIIDGNFEETELIIDGSKYPAVKRISTIMGINGNQTFTKIITDTLKEILPPERLTTHQVEDAGGYPKTTHTIEPPMKPAENNKFFKGVHKKLLEKAFSADYATTPPVAIQQVLRLTPEQRLAATITDHNPDTATSTRNTITLMEWPPKNRQIGYERTEPTLVSVRVGQELKVAMGETRQIPNAPYPRDEQIRVGLNLLDTLDDYSKSPTLQELMPNLGKEGSDPQADNTPPQDLARTAHTLLMLTLEQDRKRSPYEIEVTTSIRLTPETLKDLRERCGGDNSKVGPLIELALTLYHKSLGANL